MPASAAQISANRRNAARSTGPKTAEGKAVSRFNAVTHGMTALPRSPSRARMRRSTGSGSSTSTPNSGRAASWPRNSSTRSRSSRSGSARCRRFDTAHLGARVRSRRGEIRRRPAGEGRGTRPSRSTTDSSTATRRLQTMPEGIDRLLEHWDAPPLRAGPPRRPQLGLQPSRPGRAYLGGIVGSTLRDGREYILTQVLAGSSPTWNRSTREGLDTDAAKVEFARLELLKIYDAEIARLKDARTQLDHARIAAKRASRLTSPSSTTRRRRPSPGNTKRRPARLPDKAIQEFREAEAAGVEAVEEDSIPPAGFKADATPRPDETSIESASFRNRDEAEPEPEAEESDSVDLTNGTEVKLAYRPSKNAGKPARSGPRRPD